jgi:uncharacterized protein YjiS (DUF1127 family)
MLKSLTPSPGTAWPYAHGGGTDAFPVRSGWWRLLAGLRAYRAALARRRNLRRAMADLERLDDRMLRDIGVSRSEIGRVVRYGRGS